jgi:hypothetical protein
MSARRERRKEKIRRKKDCKAKRKDLKGTGSNSFVFLLAIFQ